MSGYPVERCIRLGCGHPKEWHGPTPPHGCAGAHHKVPGEFCECIVFMASRAVLEDPPDQLLGFQDLRSKNVHRCAAVFHPLAEWNPLEWAGAMCGEAGEAANKAKKLRRLEGADRPLDTPEHRQRLIDAFMEELADTVIYADLAAARVGRSLAKAVREKFNKVSEEKGAKERL